MLHGIVKKHWRGRESVNIIVNKFTDQVHDVSMGRCASNQFPAIFDLLEISHPMVMNVLIDHRKIEKVLIMERDAQAQDTLSTTSKVFDSFSFLIDRDKLPLRERSKPCL